MRDMSPLDNFESALYTQEYNNARLVKYWLQGSGIILRLFGSNDGGSVKGRVVCIFKKEEKRYMSPLDNFESALYTQEYTNARPVR